MMYSDVLKTLDLDGGVFGIGSVLGKQRNELDYTSIKCKLIVSGLWKIVETEEDRISQPSAEILEKFDKWDFDGISNGDEKGWKPSVLAIEPHVRGNLIWRPETIQQAQVYHQNQYGSGFRNDEATIDELARSMGDDIATARMVNSRLFYMFECETKAWSYERRKRLSDVLRFIGMHINNYMGIFTSDDSFQLFSMGPKTKCYGGNIHVTVKRPPPLVPSEIAWGSSLITTIYTDLSSTAPAPVKLMTITSW
jgi:hypothetical protein